MADLPWRAFHLYQRSWATLKQGLLEASMQGDPCKATSQGGLLLSLPFSSPCPLTAAAAAAADKSEAATRPLPAAGAAQRLPPPPPPPRRDPACPQSLLLPLRRRRLCRGPWRCSTNTVRRHMRQAPTRTVLRCLALLNKYGHLFSMRRSSQTETGALALLAQYCVTAPAPHPNITAPAVSRRRRPTSHPPPCPT